jgi:hypothetical protein
LSSLDEFEFFSILVEEAVLGANNEGLRATGVTAPDGNRDIMHQQVHAN